MRKLFFIAITFASTATFGQGNTLWEVQMVQAKTGKGNAYEKAWKDHVIKFHNGDNKRQVEQIESGPNAGNMLLISGPSSFADMDKERADAAAHGTDYDLTVTPSVESVKLWGTYAWVDTLSYNGNVQAEKFVTTIYHLKSGKMAELVAERKRALAVNKKINSPSSYNVYIKMWGGSDPELVVVSNLKDGFKQLDDKFDPSMAGRNKNFQTTYVQDYGQAAWDNRNKLIPEITTGYETFISKVRKDLSSATN